MTDRRDENTGQQERGGQYGDRWQDADYYGDTTSGQPVSPSAGNISGGGEYAERHMNSDVYRSHRPSGAARSDPQIEADVRQRLAEHDAIDINTIEVSVAQGEVTLTGSVDSLTVRQMIDDVTTSVPGVTEVHNKLDVA